VGRGSGFQGLAAGSRRAEGRFRLDEPGAGRLAREARDLIVAESPIDALSVAALRWKEPERAPARIVSTDGAGPLPEAEIRLALRLGGRVLVASDNDPAGERLYERIRAAYPEAERLRPALKDPNEDLCHPAAAAQARAEREREERERAEQERVRAAHAAELARFERLGRDGDYAREVYAAFLAARAGGLDERGAAELAAAAFARQHNGLGAETLRRHVAQGLPRSDGRSEEEARRAASEAVRAALQRAEVRAAREGHDRGR
jgi:hypothetical protein